jgi:hypothetical protein
LRLETRNTLPAYTLRGYKVRWKVHGYDDLAMEGRLDALPELAPGAHFSITWNPTLSDSRFVVVDMIHPLGHSVATAKTMLVAHH